MFLDLKKLRNFAFILIASLSFYACDSDDNEEANLSSYSVSLSGKNTVPQVADSVSGTGSATLTLNRDTGSLTGSVTVTGLTGAANGAHIHHGIAGSDGGLVVALEVDASNSNLINVPAGTVLSVSQINAMDNSEYYINIHTQANGSGEIRGQITGANQEVIRTELSGDYQAPTPVTTSNTGVAYLTVNHSTREIRGSVSTSAITNPGGGHLHNGFAGTIGGLEVTLMKDPENTIWNVPDNTILDTDQFNTLLAGGLYFNIHSTAFSDGELRGQIAPEGISVTRDELDGSQSVPANASSATAIGYTTVNTVTGEINTNVRTSGMTATFAHIHQGAAGSTGGIVVTFAQDGTDTDFWSGSVDYTSLELTPTDVISSFENEELYFNIHSDAFASGEIRSQITP